MSEYNIFEQLVPLLRKSSLLANIKATLRKVWFPEGKKGDIVLHFYFLTRNGGRK